MKNNMNMLGLTLLGLTAFVAAGCARDRGSYPNEMYGQQVTAAPQAITGQVVQDDGDSIIVRDATGQHTRIRTDRNTARDRIAVGDTVIVRVAGSSTNPYATSVTRTTVSTFPQTVVAPMTPSSYRTVEGNIVQQSGNYYVIRDNMGRDYRVHVDNTTRLDRDTRVGDRVLVTMRDPAVITTDTPYANNVVRLDRPSAPRSWKGGSPILVGDLVRTDNDRFTVRDSSGRDNVLVVDNTTMLSRNLKPGDPVAAINARPATSPYETDVYTMYRRSDTNTVQGEVIRADGNEYVVRDATGRDVRLMTDASTVRSDSIAVGDVIIVYVGPPATSTAVPATVHADSIEHR